MWPNPQFPADLVTFPEEILNGKLHFLCCAIWDHLHNLKNVKSIHGVVLHLVKLRSSISSFLHKVTLLLLHLLRYLLHVLDWINGPKTRKRSQISKRYKSFRIYLQQVFSFELICCRNHVTVWSDFLRNIY